MNKKKLREDVLTARRAILDVIPEGVSFAAILIALAELIVMFEHLTLEDED